MNTFSFIQISDHHLGEYPDALHYGYSPNHAFRQVLGHIAANTAQQADFILSNGDLVDPPTRLGYEYFRRWMNISDHPNAMPGPLAISVEGLQAYPFYFLPGNHDDRGLVQAVLFPHQAPPPSQNLRFEHKGVQFACIDWGTKAKAFTSAEMLAFLRETLDRDQPTLILSHHAVTRTGIGWLDDFLADDVSRFWEVVAGRAGQLLGILCGHTHLTYEHHVEGVPVLGIQSTSYTFYAADEPVMAIAFPQYRLVTIENGSLSWRNYEVPLARDSRIGGDS